MIARIKKLTIGEISKSLKKIPEWTINAKQTEITRSFVFHNFLNGLAFIAKITVHAEILNHHPDIELTYQKVKVRLTTHDLKGLSNADMELAKRIDNIRM